MALVADRAFEYVREDFLKFYIDWGILGSCKCLMDHAQGTNAFVSLKY